MNAIFKTVAALSIVLVMAGCATITSDPVPVLACKLKTIGYEYNYPSGSAVSSGITNSVYTYEGEKIKTTVSTISSSFTGTPTSTYTATNTYTYDVDGFVTATSSVTTPTSGSTSISSTNSAYTYANGRLMKIVSSDNTTVFNTLSYEYDTQGKVSKSINANSTYTETQTFTNGVLTATERVNTNGQVGRVYTIINGRIAKYTTGAAAFPYFEYTYDTQGNMVESKYLVSATVVSRIVTYEYNATGKIISTPTQKGFPVFPLPSQNSLRTKTTVVNGSGVKLSEIVAAYTVNAKGYVLTQNETQTTFNANGTINGTPGTTRQTYSYQDCE